MQVNFLQTGVKALLAAATLTAAMGASADPATITAIFGSGVGDGGWTAGSGDNGVVLALRGRDRFDTPTNNTNNPGGGSTYYFNAGGHSAYTFTNTLASWNFDFSVNSGSASLASYTYLLTIDIDPTAGTNLKTFSPTLLPDNAYQNAGGAVTVGTFLDKGTTNFLMQNSVNFGWMPNLAGFDPNATGTYTILLQAFNGNNVEVARTSIDVVVAVPEPASLALVGIAGLGMLAVSRRRSRA